MAGVVVEGVALDLVTLAALGVIAPRLEIGVPTDAPVVELLDPEGAPLATLSVDPASPGTGTLSDLRRGEHGPFSSWVRRPGELPLVGGLVFVHEAPTAEQLDTLVGRPVVLVPLVGHGRHGVLGRDALIRACIGVLTWLGDGSTVLPLPVPAGRDDLLVEIATAYGLPVVQLPPGGTAYPASVQAELQRHSPGGVVLFTGLSGSGKSTLARALRDRLVEGGRDVTLLDGDVVRRLLSAGLGFSPEDRDLNVRRIGYVAAEVARHGGLALAAPIAPYVRSRAAVRELVEDAGGSYLLVHVSTSLEVCEARDRKGLYARARAGEIESFTGISDPYEVPVDADLTIDTSQVLLRDAVDLVLDLLRSRALA
jgi:sulfate adenylyltransferase